MVTKISTLSDIQLAQLATYIDTDGCISIRKDKSRKNTPNIHYILQVILISTDKEEMERWHKLMGMGFVTSQIKKRPYNTLYRLAISSRQAEELLKRIRPYLSIKSVRADIALAFRETFAPQGGYGARLTGEIQRKRERYYQALKKLNSGSDNGHEEIQITDNIQIELQLPLFEM